MMPLFFFSGATAAHTYSLWIGGLDVIKEPVSARYGVPTDSITVTEAGSGGVSSMSFTIDDPSLLVRMIGDEEVILWDHTWDAPMFGGYIDSWTVQPDFGQQGRSYEVQCSGYETLLDTVAMPAMSINFNTIAQLQDPEMIQLFAGQTPLAHGTNGTETPTQAMPVQTRYSVVPLLTTVDFSGMSVRQAWAAYLAVCQAANGADIAAVLTPFTNSVDAPPNIIPDFWLSVDFYKGVRFAANAPADTGSPTQKWWSDYTTLTLTDTPTGTPAENLTYSEDRSPSAIVNAVYVDGGNAAGSGFVGTGLTPRREVLISNSAILSSQSKAAAATAVLSSKSIPAGRGSFDLTSYTPVATIHPGSPLQITDARLAFGPNMFTATTNLMITEIRKTLNSGTTQNWSVTFQPFVSTVTGLALQNGSTSTGAPSAMAAIKSA